MKGFYKVTDLDVAKEIANILASRREFISKWIEFAHSRGFADARITKGSSSFVELEFKGFAATHEQFHSVDRDVYKFLTNIRGADYTEYSVWGVRKSNKKAYQEFLNTAPYEPNEILTMVEVQEKLVEQYSPIHGVGEVHEIGEQIIFGVGGMFPVEVKKGVAEQILESEFLAMQGL